VFVKLAERQEARRLREEAAMPMKEIARLLDVSVSSVSLWTRDIVLTSDQLLERAQRDARAPARQRGTATRAERARALRQEAQSHGRLMATRGDPLHHAGCMLYWAEGSKCRNSVAFTNSDVDMHRLFVRFLVGSYEVARRSVLATVNCHLTNGLSLREIEQWWLDQLALPTASLRSASVNRLPKSSRVRRNTLVHGTLKLTVHSTFVVQSIYGAIQEYTGCDRPEWLDCAPPPRPL
jgi:transcriptional regulator with XRE-family HTH domain